MFNVGTNNVITMSRGDNATFTLYINNGTLINPVSYQLQAGDTVYLSVFEPNKLVGEYDEFNEGLIRKTFTNADLNDDNEVVISFIPTDTNDLLCGTYWYEIKLKKSDGTINTLIQNTKFILED